MADASADAASPVDAATDADAAADAAFHRPDAAADSGPRDGGSPDARLRLPDGGFPHDGGFPADGGRGPDAGKGAPDAAPSVFDSCGAFCEAEGVCFGFFDPFCVVECSHAAIDCSFVEHRAIKECAEGPCDKIDTCQHMIPCIADSPSGCGDDFCDDFIENCSNCEEDCGSCVCGDDFCAPGQCETCPEDCTTGECVCPHEVCEVGGVLRNTCGECEATICLVDPFCCETTWDPFCVQTVQFWCGKDCPAICGDFNCEEEETCETCPDDCCFFF
jgi:hypothetical protein